MLKAKAIVIGQENVIAELLEDASANKSWSFMCLAKRDGESPEEIVARLRNENVRTAIVDGFNEEAEELSFVVTELKRCGVTIVDIDDFYEKYLKKVNIFSENGNSLFEKGKRSRAFEFAKRTLDAFFAMLFLFLLFPLLALVSILIKLDSPGSILYLQRRVGLRNKEFTLYKFRTMIEGAEKDKAVWADLDDPRVTKLGRLLRRFRIDELPQLLNVLKGEMSIVGPRPERPEFVRKLREKIPRYDERHEVKPGLTGWAQVNFRYGASVDDAAEKLKYDLYYVKHRSILFDLLIMLKTVAIVMRGKGR